MTIVLLVLNLVLNTYTTLVTNEAGRTQVENCSDYIIVDEANF